MKPLTAIRYVASALALAGAVYCGVRTPGAWDQLSAGANRPPFAWSDAFREMTIVVDPGHGGHDGGATANEGLEKSLALDMGKRLRDYLVEQGFQVMMTRDTDVFVPLEERSGLSNRMGADLFVSLHLNANAESSETAGVETYFCSRKNLGDVARLRREKNLPEGLSLQDKRSEWLASLIHESVCRKTGAADRGVRDSSYLVARLTESPAVLVECGYLTNAAECARLRDKTYQQKLATGVGEAVVRFAKATIMNPRRGIHLEEGQSTPPGKPTLPPADTNILTSAPTPGSGSGPSPGLADSGLTPALLPTPGSKDLAEVEARQQQPQSPPAATALPPGTKPAVSTPTREGH